MIRCLITSALFFLLVSAFAQKYPSKEAAYDRIAGMLIGSAIGDAMGAPTEMWGREQIQARYGFVTGLDSMVREPSPEGTWRLNLPAGGSTDDTRWKVLAMEFLIEYLPKTKNPEPAGMAFAKHILDTYDQTLKRLRQTQGSELDAYQAAIREAEWLVEWEKVARPYVANDHAGYLSALHRFYGGEPVCGGILFSPAVGVCFPGEPEKAYRLVYDMNIFDLGNGRDLAALVAAMTAEAAAGKTPEQQLAVFRSVDPEGFFKSRLVGRTAYAVLADAQYLALKARKTIDPGTTSIFPFMVPGSDSAFEKTCTGIFPDLDIYNERLPFHPVEITRIGLTGMLIGGFDFMRSLQFIINFGRDNDTVAAWVGGQLGAGAGYKGLPEDLCKKVEKVSKEQLLFDLKEVSSRLAEVVIFP